MSVFDAREFDIGDKVGRLVYELFSEMYGGPGGVKALVVVAGLAQVPIRGVNTNQAPEHVVYDVLQAAAKAQRTVQLVHEAAGQNAAYRDQLLGLVELGAQESPGVERTPLTNGDSWQDRVTSSLCEGRSRAPLLVALESDEERPNASDLLPTERHLTVRLTPVQIAALRSAAASAIDVATAPGATVDDLAKAGGEIWTELVGAEPRLKGLLERIAKEGDGQPVAWCGRTDLLADLRHAVLMAHPPNGAVGSFVSADGGHFFLPTDVARHRTIRPRPPDRSPVLRDADLRMGEADPPRALSGADVVLLVGARGEPDLLHDLCAAVQADADSHTRAIIAFGAGPADARLVAEVLDTMPFLSLAPEPLANEPVLRLLKRLLRTRSVDHALACVVGVVRAELLRETVVAGDTKKCVDVLMWSSWSWIGRPLFPANYDDLRPAAYPHLMDLRSITPAGWYLDRHADIDAYEAEQLATQPAGKRFHLYVSGAGGTGKSCFLRYLHDQISLQSPKTVPVWYRVDAPSSLWENIEKRVREATLDALRSHSQYAELVEPIDRLPAQARLWAFLNSAVKLLREYDPEFDEIVVFVDQLERTFESGDEPDFARLTMISQRLAALLEQVGSGEGVRVFIASRKQYLPDFLRSSRAGQERKLEFNVLQSIDNYQERIAFVQRVVAWCQSQQLVDVSLTLSAEATTRIAQQAHGHPLNMMLTLIQLLATRTSGEVTGPDLDELLPWENLFALDLRIAARDDLDWHFLLAMAHARTEIVRFEEVWWRLRMVDPRLTERVEELGPLGILERLWLFGYLGTTLHLRPDENNRPRFVEFFHANLRDHLLRNVMARGGTGDEVRRRRTGTPPAWRALDRLASHARDWQQMQQWLPADELRALMEHRIQLIDRSDPFGDGKRNEFDLLFLRESDKKARDALSEAAKQCVAYSALFHDDLGRSTFAYLYADADERVTLCTHWLQRHSPAEGRTAVLAYLVEERAPSAVQALVRLVLDEKGPAADVTRGHIAALLAEPLYGERLRLDPDPYREEILAAILRTELIRQHGEVDRLPDDLVAFVVASARGERTTLVRLLTGCAERFEADADPVVRRSADVLASSGVPDRWLGPASASDYAGVQVAERRALPTGAVVGLVVGEAMRAVVDAERVDRWSRDLIQRLGVPLPQLRVLSGEAEEEHALELRSHRGRLATNVFYADRVCVELRRWQAVARTAAYNTPDTSDIAWSEQSVLWLSRDVVARADYPFPARELDEAVVDWLEDHCRRSFDLFLDDDLLNRIVRDTPVAPVARTRPLLREVLVDLVEEGVPLGPLRSAVFAHLVRLSGREDEENLTQTLREAFSVEICSSVADETGEVTALILEDELEQGLVGVVRPSHGRPELALEPAQASQLSGAVRRAAEVALADPVAPPLIIVTESALRYALARQLWRFDIRYPVLSYRELELDVLNPRQADPVSAAGLLRDWP